MSTSKSIAAFFLVLFALVSLLGLEASQSLAQTGQPPTPTLIAVAFQYLPAVRGSQMGPTATATTPPPTLTPLPTATDTPEPTDTPAPGRLAAPTLYDIVNPQQQPSFVVGWSSAPDAEFYQLQQQRNSGTWQQVYEGPQKGQAFSNLNAGQYCYRVRALNAVTDSEWSTIKCTTVALPTSTPTSTPSASPTATKAPEGLSSPVIAPIGNADGDGNYTVSWSAVERAQEYILREGGETVEDSEIIYRGTNTSLQREELPPGRYCYWVRGIIVGGEWGPWSEKQCTEIVHPTPQFLQCNVEIVGEFLTPGLYGHRMTYLHQSDLIVITGGTFLGKGFGDPPNSCGPSVTGYCDCGYYDFCTGYSSQIYVYDVKTKELHQAGFLDLLTNDKIALPWGDDKVLLTGSDSQDDVIIHIEARLGGYDSYISTIEPRLSDVINGIPIDSETALLVRDSTYGYHAFVYNLTEDRMDSSIGYFNAPGWLLPGEAFRPLRVGAGESKFIFSAGAGWVSIDVNSKQISTHLFPVLSDCAPEYEGNCPRIDEMDVSPINKDELLLSNGIVEQAPTAVDFPPIAAAFVVDATGKLESINETVFASARRIHVPMKDGYVFLLNGYINLVGPNVPSEPGAELYDPVSRSFADLEIPVNKHAHGNALLLEGGIRY